MASAEGPTTSPVEEFVVRCRPQAPSSWVRFEAPRQRRFEAVPAVGSARSTSADECR
ncbi:hypothetical protein YM304_39720 [Ilumatobacter coccineus YM16-304]|uniref:Uncharacterized protein n=1 Tax=Ilumatobacter coccineus (strain NBRC 103263 / KCTC 29153 / YM16-304) TaxID=1313172 RepID=A0A6C7EK06_ILUCY|nr:hypothetical protein YM304_39720 [Ilumatobacter coccineus YM16-304]